jgi:predicted permease
MNRLWNLVRKRRLDREIDEELQFHLDARTRDNIWAGMDPDVSRESAVRHFGNRTLATERTREANGFPRLESVVQDFVYAVRSLRKTPGFTAVAVLTLALGVGANTAIFSVVYNILLKPFPYANSSEIVAVSMHIPQLQSRFPSVPVRAADFQEFRRSSHVFADIAAIRERDFTSPGAAIRNGSMVHASRRICSRCWACNPVSAVRSCRRTTHPDATTLSWSATSSGLVMWEEIRTRWGRTLMLDGRAHTIIGVMPQGFLFPAGKQLHPMVELGPRIDIWKPMAFTASELSPADFNRFSWGVIGRPKPGMSLHAAQDDLNAMAKGIRNQLRAKVPRLGQIDLRTQLVPIREVFAGKRHQALVMVMSAAGLLLAIACVNLVNLLIARLSVRSRELATRAALGASRSRIVRQVLTESMVLAAAGGLAGLPLAVWGARLLLLLGPADLSLDRSFEFNAPVFLFALSIVLLTGLAIGILPAFQMTNSGLNGLTDGARGTSSGRESGALRRVLVTAEVALCTGLLIIAGLLLRSFMNVMGVDKGFAVERALSVDLDLSAERYAGSSQSMAFYRELLDRIRALPGVVAAGAINVLPLTSGSEGQVQGVYLEGDTEQRLDRPVAQYRIATQGYFAAMSIPAVAGRLFEAQEPGLAAIVSEELVRLLWPGSPPASAIGRRVLIGDLKDDPVPIVGVVGNIRAASVDGETTPAIYVPHARNRVRGMTIVMRTANDPETLIAAVRNQIWQRDRSIPVPTFRTMREIVSDSVAARRVQMAIILVFAMLALGLALVGIYGVASYAVARQTRDIGVRFAIGAQPSLVLRQVLTQGLRPVALGLIVGLFGAGVAAFSIQSVLFGIVPLDPLTLALVCSVLFLAATLACYIPARRAARVDPMMALRAE